MREIDEALARAYAESNRAGVAQGVPPAPHWPVRGLQTAIPTAVPQTTLAAAELQWRSSLPACAARLLPGFGAKFG